MTIKKNIEAWNFVLAFKMIREKKDFTAENLEYLYQCGRFEQIYEKIKHCDNIPEFWNPTFFNFDIFKEELQRIIYRSNCEDKHESVLDKISIVNYVVRRKIDNLELTLDEGVNYFKDIISLDNGIGKIYCILNLISYFYKIDCKFFNNETRNILAILQSNINTFNCRVANDYYDMYMSGFKNNNYQDVAIKSNKKVAILVSGALRGVNWEEHLKKISEYFDFDFDLFLFTWNQWFYWPGLKGDGEFWANRYLSQELIGSIPEKIKTKTNFKLYFPHTYSILDKECGCKLKTSKIKKNHIIKHYIIEDQEDFFRTNNINPNGRANTSKLWYSNYQLLKLVELYEKRNNIKYDFMIKIRPDCAYKINFNIQQMERLEFNQLMIRHHFNLNSGLNDSFAAGRRSAMEIYLSLWNNAALNTQFSFFNTFPNFQSEHDMLLKYCCNWNLNCCLDYDFETIGFLTSNDYIMPDFEEYFAKDRQILIEKNILPIHEIQNIEKFLNSCKAYFHSKDKTGLFDFFKKRLKR
ncbi:hypothetical protein L8X97_06920 [Campylobacter sp. CNRCH_2013_0671h]|uniref:hypothetical protein n=1 Tax=Campylobacter sp. CNRCH_2013_0671h TaxID=2911599 RepID=UPI0021E68B68|nr:hypothetical protein [Campylobacter sp. CNRCH_2013_0671h]MCV3549174.1 hypothetical protein [Campylobacter sp. CNRCH_2013_0671h]